MLEKKQNFCQPATEKATLLRANLVILLLQVSKQFIFEQPLLYCVWFVREKKSKFWYVREDLNLLYFWVQKMTFYLCNFVLGLGLKFEVMLNRQSLYLTCYNRPIWTLIWGKGLKAVPRDLIVYSKIPQKMHHSQRTDAFA